MNAIKMIISVKEVKQVESDRNLGYGGYPANVEFRPIGANPGPAYQSRSLFGEWIPANRFSTSSWFKLISYSQILIGLYKIVKPDRLC